MDKTIILPVMVANKITLGKKTVQMWRNAIFTVKKAQEQFLAAYECTLNDAIPGWRETWHTDPHFPVRLAEVEEYMRAICRQNGMQQTTFTRYRRAARASMLGGVPFSLANSFSIQQIRQIKDGQTDATTLKRSKWLRAAESVVSKQAAVLPLPSEDENPVDYIECIGGRFAEYLRSIKEPLGEAAFVALTLEIQRCLALGGSQEADDAAQAERDVGSPAPSPDGGSS